MERVLSAVSAAAEIEGCTVYVYVNNIKVAEDGLERCYLQGRDKGATYFKLTRTPRIGQADGKLSIDFSDPVLRQDIELEPDMVVVEEAIIANPGNPALAELLRIKKGPADFLQTENVHNYPVRSNREGVFVVGAGRKIGRLSGALTDAANIALAVRDLLGDGTVTVPRRPGGGGRRQMHHLPDMLSGLSPRRHLLGKRQGDYLAGGLPGVWYLRQ